MCCCWCLPLRQDEVADAEAQEQQRRHSQQDRLAAADNSLEEEGHSNLEEDRRRLDAAAVGAERLAGLAAAWGSRQVASWAGIAKLHANTTQPV